MTRRTIHSWIFTLTLLGLIVLAYGLDWQAALWGDLHGPVFEYYPSDGIHTRYRCDEPGTPACYP